MKIFAFAKKDLKETLPAGILLTLLVSGALFLIFSYADRFEKSFFSNSIYLENPTPEEVIPLLMFLNIGTGIMISLLQFWQPWYMKTWTFHCQRNISKTYLIWAKLTAGILSLIFPTTLLWIAVCLYIRAHFPVPLGFDAWFEGFLAVCWGVVFYFAGALSSILPARLYTTRFFPLLIAVIALIYSVSVITNYPVFLCLVIISFFFVCQILDEIQTREF